MQTTNSSNKGYSPKLIQWNELDGDADSVTNYIPIKPGPLLLTAAPMESFIEEFEYISKLGLSFDKFTTCILFELARDSHAEQLRAATSIFCSSMFSVANDIHLALLVACDYYNERVSFPYGPLTLAEDFACLLDPEFRTRRTELAHKVGLLVSRAAKTMRTVALPLLPQLEKHVDRYVTGYLHRLSVKAERDNSKLPVGLQDFVWGVIDPIPQPFCPVVQLRQHLSAGENLLLKLPAFLDNMELHFRRLGDIDEQQLLQLGYKSVEDFYRLLQDRLISHNISYEMVVHWRVAQYAFPYGRIDQAFR